MSVQNTFFDPALQNTTSGRKAAVPQNLSTDFRFRNILTMMQDDGVIAKDAETFSGTLSDDQKAQLREKYDIENMACYSDKRALLNELVKMGAITAEQSELSMCQLLPPQGPAGSRALGTGWEQSDELEAMLSEPNYISYLEKAIAFDELWSRSDDVKSARSALYDILREIYS